MELHFKSCFLSLSRIQHLMKDYHKALTTFDEAMKVDASNADLLDARDATRQAIATVATPAPFFVL